MSEAESSYDLFFGPGNYFFLIYLYEVIIFFSFNLQGFFVYFCKNSK